MRWPRRRLRFADSKLRRPTMQVPSRQSRRPRSRSKQGHHSSRRIPLFQNRQTDSALNRHDRRDQKQRPQAELKPVAFAFRRLGFHRRIIPDRERAEQGILGVAGRGSRDPGRPGARLTRFVANQSILQDRPDSHPIGREIRVVGQSEIRDSSAGEVEARPIASAPQRAKAPQTEKSHRRGLGL